MKKKSKVSAYSIVVGSLLTVYTLAIILMFLWAVSASLKTSEGYGINPIWFNGEFNFNNYVVAFLNGFDKIVDGVRHVFIEEMFLNSIIYSAGGALCQAFCTSVVAYLIAKYDCRFSRFMHNVIIITMILPIVGALPSQIQIMDFLHLRNSFFGSFVMHYGFTNVYYMIFYAAYKKLPWSYAESALIDGANHYQIFYKIMMPLTSSLFGTTFILFFITFWNDYQTPMLFLEKSPVLAWGLYEFFHSYDNVLASGTVKIAGGIVVLIPLVILFLIFRNKLMGNMTEGGIKG